jgi:hypothetical protein
LLSTPRKLKKLGDLIKEQTVEYRLADELYTELERAELVLCNVYKKSLQIVGSPSDWIGTGKPPKMNNCACAIKRSGFV